MLGIVVLYLSIRYLLAKIVSRFSVHRGMFHSIPAMLIAAELAFLSYPSSSQRVRLLIAAGVALGFFSHLLLDEIYSVEINGMKVGLKKSSGTAIKMFGDAFLPNVLTFTLAATLSYASLMEAGLIRENPELAPKTEPSPTAQQADERNVDWR